MTGSALTLNILLVEDDQENLELLEKTLPSTVAEYSIQWEPCSDFEEAVRRVETRRYDVIVTDIYRDREGRQKGTDPEDEKAIDIIRSIKDRRFCPIVAFTSGSKPQTFELGPFVKFADKTKGNDEIIARLEELLTTGIPAIARKLHDELDRVSGSYLWEFLENNWDRLLEAGFSDPAVLERLVRRRAALQIGRLDPVADAPTEVESVEGVEYYIYPSVAGDELRLGEILRHKNDNTFRVVLTPHCHLVVHSEGTTPKADHVTTVKAFPAEEIILKSHTDAEGNVGDLWPKSAKKKLDMLRRRVQSPAGELGSPKDRYYYLPNFLDIPAMYCDLLQLESLPYETLEKEYECIAVLDTPFAEALQSCFTRFYSAVGVPELKLESQRHLME